MNQANKKHIQAIKPLTGLSYILSYVSQQNKKISGLFIISVMLVQEY